MITFTGAPGGTAYYIIYKKEKSYWCKMKTWNQYKGYPAGDFAIWRTKQGWRATGRGQQYAEQIGRYISDWNSYSESYKEHLRKGFKYLDEKE